MKVVIINRSDALGGAAIASSRLCHALCQAGADARMLVLDRRTDDVAVQAVGTPLGNRYRFLAERLGIFLRNGFSRERLFLIDTATQGVDLSCHPWVREADVIVLGWINQAMLSLEGVARLASLGKPLVWVMHDMWNATGVCHHAEDCQGLNGQCEQCPLLPAGSRLAQRTWLRKLELYKNGDIHFVAVSNWLRKVCQESSLMRECDITVIRNAIDVARFDPVFLDDNPWGVEPGRQVVVMGAARLMTLARVLTALLRLCVGLPIIILMPRSVYIWCSMVPCVITRCLIPFLFLSPTWAMWTIFRACIVMLTLWYHHPRGSPSGTHWSRVWRADAPLSPQAWEARQIS